MNEFRALIRDWEKAKKGWNNDNGPIEKTAKAGEELYFSACNLIERLMIEADRR